MKKSFSKALALTLTGVMLSSTSVWAAPVVTTTGTVDGVSTIMNPIYLVDVPTDADFTINPLKIGLSGTDITTQVYSDPLLVVNKSNVPVEMNVKVETVLGGTVKPTVSLEDAVLAASADITVATKLVSLYVAPATKTKLTAAGDVLDTTTPTDNTFAMPTKYIGIGGTSATGATFTAVLNASDNYGDTLTDVWEAPGTLANSDTAVAFAIKGSVNKNATWDVADVKLKVTWKFAGVDADSYETDYTYIAPYLNISKAASGTGTIAATPRFRVKTVVQEGTPSADLTLATDTFELGTTATAAWKAYIADSANTANAATGTGFVVSALTLNKDGVANTTLIPTASLASNFEVTVATSGEEKGAVATVKLKQASAEKLLEGSTYEIKAITLKLGSAATTYIVGANGGMKVIVNEAP